jgi:lipopolysaccharide biosynthesis glycosyltransferase
MNLVYYSVGSQLNYIEVLKISIDSLRSFGNYSGDIGIICDKNFIAEISKRIDNVIFFENEATNSPMHSSANKLSLYKYKKMLNKYKKFIYLDTDIIIQNDFNIILDSTKDFSFCAEKKLINKNGRLEYIDDFHSIADDSGWFGDYFLSQDELNSVSSNKFYAINAGIFGFKSNNLDNLESIYNIYMEDSRNSTYYEQPSLNYFRFKNKIYSIPYTKYSRHHVKEYHYDEYNKDDIVILHFCGNIADGNAKYSMMSEYFSKIKLNKESIQ